MRPNSFCCSDVYTVQRLTKGNTLFVNLIFILTDAKREGEKYLYRNMYITQKSLQVSTENAVHENSTCAKNCCHARTHLILGKELGIIQATKGGKTYKYTNNIYILFLKLHRYLFQLYSIQDFSYQNYPYSVI